MTALLIALLIATASAVFVVAIRWRGYIRQDNADRARHQKHIHKGSRR